MPRQGSHHRFPSAAGSDFDPEDELPGDDDDDDDDDDDGDVAVRCPFVPSALGGGHDDDRQLSSLISAASAMVQATRGPR